MATGTYTYDKASQLETGPSLSDRMSSDPAALSDWLECVSAVLAEDNNK
jgi:hypothetical protein